MARTSAEATECAVTYLTPTGAKLTPLYNRCYDQSNTGKTATDATDATFFCAASPDRMIYPYGVSGVRRQLGCFANVGAKTTDAKSGVSLASVNRRF